MPTRIISVRYAGSCSKCSIGIPAKTRAWWDSEAKSLRCESCRVEGITDPATPSDGHIAVTEPLGPPDPGLGPLALPRNEEATVAPSGSPTRVRSLAGASAQRQFERKHVGREKRIREQHPHLGGLILALSEDPQSTTAWVKGAEGERRVGARLDSLAGAGVIALHDRLIPGSKANIDHLAVAPGGVWVIDAKRYSGAVAKKDVGGWLRTDVRLYVGRRDCSKLVTAMARQVAATRSALGPGFRDVPVRPLLCFVDADWGWFAKPFELQGVMVAWPKAAAELLSRPGALSPEQIDQIVTRLETGLHPA